MRVALLALLFVCVTGQARSDEALPPKVLERIKQATVFVRVEAGPLSGSGSGFLVKTDGDAAYLVTNHHVVRPSEVTARLARPPMQMRPGMRRPGLPHATIVTRVVTAEKAAISVVFFSGTSKEKVIKAEVVGTDDIKDLAILKIEKFSQLPTPIDISREAQPIETMSVYIIGFPFGELLSSTKGNPSITIGKGSVTGLPRNAKDELAYVQFDGSLNPGNSGGPVVDSQGRLVGIAVSHFVLGSSSTGINKAIPELELSKLLNGRVGTPHLQVVSKESDGFHVKVELDLVDPSAKIKTVTLRYAPGAAPADKKLAGKSSIPLKIDNHKAIGELVLPEASRATVSFQTEYVRSDGAADLTDVRTIRMPVPPPPGGTSVAQPAGPQPTLPPPKTPPPASQIAGLVGYWSFDDGDIAHPADQSGKKHQVRAEGIGAVAGIRGKAINFGGPDSFVDLGDTADFNFPTRQQFTVACWVKTTIDSGTVVAFRNSNDDGALMTILIQDNRLRIMARQDRASSPVQLVGLSAINDDQWHHAALVREGATISFYVDGHPQGKGTERGIDESITTNWRFLGREQYWLNMGQKSFAGMKGYYAGAIDEFCIFRRALSVEEIRTLAGR